MPLINIRTVFVIDATQTKMKQTFYFINILFQPMLGSNDSQVLFIHIYSLFLFTLKWHFESVIENYSNYSWSSVGNQI